MAVRVRETAPPPKRPRGRTALLVVGAVVVVAALVATAFYFGTRSSGGSGQTGASDLTPSPSTTAAAMPTGEASAALGLSTRKVAGYSARGFPQTEAGAVEAAMSWKNTMTQSTSQSDEAALAAISDGAPATNPDETRQFLAQGRETSGLASDGSFPELAPGERYYDECLAAYGAYRVAETSASAVRVEIWTPCLYGPGSPDSIDRLQVRWSATSYDMAWENGDWRVTNGYGRDEKDDPVPANKNRVDTTYRERAELLGNGWELFKGSSQGWPSDLLGAEPGQLS